MKKTAYVLLIISTLFLITCKKAPELVVKNVNFISEDVEVLTNSATVTIKYSYLSKLDYVNAYLSQSNYFGSSSIVPAEVSDSTIVINFTNLQAGVTYYYKYDYSNGLNEASSDVKTFSMGGSTGDPVVNTKPVEQLTMTTVKVGGTASAGPNYQLSSFNFGFCWSTTPNPTISDSYLVIDKTSQDFEKILVTGLQPGTTYYLRAYIDNVTVYYGNVVSFTTCSEWGGGTPSEGYINHLFSTSDTTKVWFSKGNLQYQASTNTYRFAENQLDLLREENNAVSPTNSGWIDVFPFGTSGWYAGTNIDNYPYDIDGVSNNSYSDYVDNFDGDYQYADWGIYNPIANGGNVKNQWYCLTKNEFGYITGSRTTTSGMRFVFATIGDICGRIIFPDEWNASTYSFNYINGGHVSNGHLANQYYDNEIPLSDWTNIIEPNGAVFLPVKYTGDDSNTTNLFYWGNYPGSHVPGFTVGIYNGMVLPAPPRSLRCSVRLVHHVE